MTSQHQTFYFKIWRIWKNIGIKIDNILILNLKISNFRKFFKKKLFKIFLAVAAAFEIFSQQSTISHHIKHFSPEIHTLKYQFFFICVKSCSSCKLRIFLRPVDTSSYKIATNKYLYCSHYRSQFSMTAHFFHDFLFALECLSKAYYGTKHTTVHRNFHS